MGVVRCMKLHKPGITIIHGQPIAQLLCSVLHVQCTNALVLCVCVCMIRAVFSL